jgi:hypothetical protein
LLLERLRSLVTKPTTTNDALQRISAIGDSEDINMEVDATALDHVIDGVTYGILEPVNTPIGRKTTSLMPPPSPTSPPSPT